ncbi:uncharacterized protein LOC126768058 [Bactrocera neohumeralis]|uniref:uncharacterized protein LOC126768058 n=1 Tax=Bactrocera neohumeralis TaxID=98809 RepID=UPI002166444A|nr:uncharacterized protein LOC126768058 [Bactrocera neohumeralis]XP_050341898.1 uncharacterized protein LOC126768058 [Bactrocera neohumeralis]XP_050341899.1 uncharacterized protein LOC126768058 [Bactrocera neohumeralis]
MLVATPGQTTTYSLLGSSAPKKTCLLNSSATPKSSINNSTASTNSNNSSNTAATLMKTIQVRLNRGTEFLKDTVQKALISNTTNPINTTTNTSSISFRNNNNKININSSVVGTIKPIHASSALASVPAKTTLVGKSTYTTDLSAAPSTSSGAIARTSITANTSKPLKLNTVPPTKIHRYPQERQETSSTDSINKEMCHFKPILPAPTIRWKCGSKSRGGATIKIPVACLATNIKNLNCDDCSKLVEDSSEGEQDVNEDEAMGLEDTKHPHKYHLFKPNPSSTLLSTIITAPSHQSAFVRLVAQMKTLVNIRQTPCEKPHKSAKKKDQYKSRHTARRGRTNAALALKMQQLRKSPISLPLTQLLLRSRKPSFVQVNKLNLPTELIMKKSRTATAKANPIATSKSTNAVKDKKRTAALSVQVDTKKGKRNTSKSNIINIVAFAHDKNSTQNVKRTLQTSKSKVTTNVGESPAPETKYQQRKRKHVDELCAANEVVGSELHELRKTSSTEASNIPPLRKSARLSKDGNNELLTIGTVKRITLRKRNTRYTQQRSVDTFSPPMTRSRRKELMQKQCSPFVMDDNSQLIV